MNEEQILNEAIKAAAEASAETTDEDDYVVIHLVRLRQIIRDAMGKARREALRGN